MYLKNEKQINYEVKDDENSKKFLAITLKSKIFFNKKIIIS